MNHVALICVGIAVMLMVGCTKPGVYGSTTNNREFFVEMLFEHDGCKVYRFDDGGRAHYYTNCTETMTTQYCGKGCVRSESIKSKQPERGE